jgi:acetamidase/formamidase
MLQPDKFVPEEVFSVLGSGLDRRTFLRATAAIAAATPMMTAIAPDHAQGAPNRGAGDRSDLSVLQPHTGKIRGTYIPSTVENVRWGRLPNSEAEPVAVVASRSVVTFDTVSHEGILEDQGRDPIAYFGDNGVPSDAVLQDAIAIASSDLVHDFDFDGPHIVTGPVFVRGAERGDVLAVDVLEIRPRVPYGVISSRHGKGALPGEMPPGPIPPNTTPPAERGNVSVFCSVAKRRGRLRGVLPEGGAGATFPLAPFPGIMGVAVDVQRGGITPEPDRNGETPDEIDSIPPTVAGGNLDIQDLAVGSRLYLPVFAPGALFFTGDPHLAQGHGEVALTALESSMRITFRLTLFKRGDPAIPGDPLAFDRPFAETPEFWIPVGLSDYMPGTPTPGDVNLAMRAAVREALDFLGEELGMDRAVAYAYLSAATDFVVSQFVDRSTGVHGLIRKADFGR